MKRIEVKIGLTTFSFGEETYKEHRFFALKKWIPSVKGSAPKHQVISVSVKSLPEFKKFLHTIVVEPE